MTRTIFVHVLECSGHTVVLVLELLADLLESTQQLLCGNTLWQHIAARKELLEGRCLGLEVASFLLHSRLGPVFHGRLCRTLELAPLIGGASLATRLSAARALAGSCGQHGGQGRIDARSHLGALAWREFDLVGRWQGLADCARRDGRGIN